MRGIELLQVMWLLSSIIIKSSNWKPPKVLLVGNYSKTNFCVKDISKQCMRKMKFMFVIRVVLKHFMLILWRRIFSKFTKNTSLISVISVMRHFSINVTKINIWLKVSWFQNVLLVPLFWPKNQRNFLKNFCPSLDQKN